jgi:hypothetical protein
MASAARNLGRSGRFPLTEIKTVHLVYNDGNTKPVDVKVRDLLTIETIVYDGLYFVLRGFRNGFMKFEQSPAPLVIS